MLIEVNLKDILKEKRYTITEVAEATGITANTISLICNKKNNGISYKVLDKLCDFLQCEPGDILKYHREKVA